MLFTKTNFGHTQNNEPVTLYHLENSSGAYIELLDYGCRLRSICVPDRTGTLRDVCLGYECIGDYESDSGSLGAAVGRHANRIGGAAFTVNGITYPVEKNDGNNHLHGGSKGFAFRMWNAVQKDDKIIFSRHFPDGEDGYPGNLDVTITYQWSEDNQLTITYQGISDRDTVYNVTNHTYFNLDGQEEGSILDHELMLLSSSITENDSESLPTGVLIPVADTPFDFRTFKTIGRDINIDNIQLKYGSGYDHNFVLDGTGYRKIGILQSPASGIRMTCHTDQPGIQVYTANYLGGCKGKYGGDFHGRNSICLETQYFPNATNIPEFPSVILKANEAFTTVTSYCFDIMD